MDRICFDKPTFQMYGFILAFVLLFLIYINFSSQSLNLKQENNRDVQLFQTILQLKNEIKEFKQSSVSVSKEPQSTFLDKIYNPLSGTSPIYPGRSFGNSGYNAFYQFQMLGYLTGPSGQFPVMGRYRDSNRTDKFEYFCLNEGRNRVKINFKTKNYNELFDGDSVNIQELGGELMFKKYEDRDNNRYNSYISE